MSKIRIWNGEELVETQSGGTASDISLTDISNNFTSINVEGALEELFISASNVKTNVASAITGMGQTANGSDTGAQLASKISAISSDTTSLVGDVLSGKTFYASGKKTGTMANNGAVTITPSTANQTIAVGYHNGSGVVNGDADLITANIKNGINIFGVVGNYDYEATNPITAGDVIASHVGFVNGAKITGTMVEKIGSNTIFTPSTSDQAITAGRYGGALTDGKVLGDADLVAENIKYNVNIFGVVGSYDREVVNPITASNIISGKIGFVNGLKVTGTMVDKVGSATLITPSTVDQAIPAGRYGGVVGDGKVIGDADLIAGNIKNNVNIFGVVGNYDYEATNPITVGDVLSGHVGFVNGVKVTGTMPNYSSGNYSSNSCGSVSTYINLTIPNSGYYASGVTISYDDSDFLDTNIKTGVNVLGKVGTFTADANAIASQLLTAKTAYVNGAKITGTLAPKLTNLVSNGSFENSSNGWTFGATGSISPLSGKFGTHSLKFASLGQYELAQTPVIPIVIGHKYYVSGWYTKTGGGTTALYVYESTLSSGLIGGIEISADASTYTFVSALMTNASYTLAKVLAYGACSGYVPAMTVNWDGITLIDLTDAFGAGKEPTKADMDAIISANGGGWDSPLTNLTYDANAVAGDMKVGKKAYVNGALVTGNKALRGVSNPSSGYEYCTSVSTSGGFVYLLAPAGIYDNDTWIYYIADNHCLPENIKKGVNILNAVGTYDPNLCGTLTFSGTYATSTYFTQAGCYMASTANGQVIVVIQSGTSASYENVLFTIASQPASIGILTNTATPYASNATQQYFCCILTNVTQKINVAVDFNTINATYDYVNANLTITYAP